MDGNLRTPSDLAAYLRETEWLTALARHLVLDPATADDLVQDTWLAFLRRGADEAPARPWLATVLKNFARERHRSGAARARRERATAPAEASGADAALAVERAELARRVFDEVLALDEPFRSTILLRYAEGRSSAAIARSAGVPEGTVRWRLKEGLDRVRARFDAQHGGDRGAWVALLAPLMRPAVRVPIAVASSVVAAMLAVAIGVVLVWRAARDPADPAPVVAARDPAPPAAAPPALLVEPVRAATAVVREEQPASMARITVRTLDGSARPIEGARVREEGHEDAPTATTDRDGRAELAIALERPAFVGVVVECLGYERALQHASIAPGCAVALGEVTLAPGLELSGIVVDASGAPVGDAEVFAVSHEVHGPFDEAVERGDPREVTLMGQSVSPFEVAPLPATRTDERGRFALEGLPLDGFSIFAHAEGTDWTRASVDLRDPAARAAVRLVLQPGAAVAAGGVVTTTFSVSRFDGTSVSSSSIRFDADHPLRVRVASAQGLALDGAKLLVLDANKRFVPCSTQRDAAATGTVFVVPRANAPVFFSVVAPLHKTRLVGPIDPKSATSAVDVALEPAELVAGVVTHDGTPVAGARVALAFADEGLKNDRGFASRAFTDFSSVTQTDANGRFALELAHDLANTWLSVRHEDVGVLSLGPEDLAARAAIDALTLELAEGGALDVRVPVPKGTSASGFVVGVHDGLGCLLCARTDADGIARFAHVAPGDVQVTRLGREENPYAGVGEGKRRLDARVAPVRNATIVAGETESVALDGAGLRSRVVVRVTLDGVAATGDAQRYVTDAVRVARVRFADGAFALAAPAAGPGEVWIRVDGASSLLIKIAKTWGGGDERIDFDLRTAKLRGRVLAPRKERSRLTWVWHGPNGATCEERIRVADDGTFALDSILAGDAQLRARDEVVATFTVAPGETKTIDVP